MTGHQEPFDRVSLHDVALHDFLHIRLGGDAIPDAFGIDDHARPLRAVVQTPGFIGTDDSFQVESFRLLFEAGMQRVGAELGATAARVVRFPFVGADENVSLVPGHANGSKSVGRECLGTGMKLLDQVFDIRRAQERRTGRLCGRNGGNFL